MSSPNPGPSSDDGAGTAARRARQAARRQGSGDGPGAPAETNDGDRSSRSAVEADSTAGPSGSSGRRHRAGAELDPDALAALEEERAFLLDSLDDLEREHDAGDVDEADFLALKDDYTARAAAVIRSIENRHAAFQEARPPRRPARTLAWVAGLLVVAIGLGMVVAQASGRREAGESASGDIRQTSRDLLLQARSLSSSSPPDYLGAIELYDEVLASQPANTEALTYKGWLLYQTARQAEDPSDSAVLAARANELLDDAVEIDPEYGDARVFRASVLGFRGFPERGIADLDEVRPGSIPEFMNPLVAQLRAGLVSETESAVPRPVPDATAPGAAGP